MFYYLDSIKCIKQTDKPRFFDKQKTESKRANIFALVHVQQYLSYFNKLFKTVSNAFPTR